MAELRGLNRTPATCQLSTTMGLQLMVHHDMAVTYFR